MSPPPGGDVARSRLHPRAPLARALRWLIPLRYPVALGATLLTLPAVADAPAARLFLGNLFVLGTPELAVVGLLTPLAAWTAVRTARLVLAKAPARSGVPPWPWPARRPALGSASLVAALSVPIVVTALARSSIDPPVAASRLAAHVVALALGAIVAAAAVFVGERWVGSHRGALGSALVFGFGYGVVGFAFHPARSPDGCLTAVRIVDGGLCFPALGYVLIVAALCGWTLAGAAFWLDRYGVPTLLVVVLIALAPLPWTDADHVYRTDGSTAADEAAEIRRTAATTATAATSATAPPSPAVTAADVVAAVVARQSGRPRLVVVAASGGGSAAALWTATVLTRLEEANGWAFTRALGAVSSVSGGSFGSLVYLAPVADGRPRPPAMLAAIRAAAAQPTLRPVAWGLAYPDLWRVVLAPAVGPWLPRADDRGWAAEQAWGDVWRRTLARDDAAVTLRSWRAAVRRGAMPAPIFNAMAVETGRQMLLTPLDLAAAGDGAPFDTFFGTYPERDVRAVTAARLSAAFPWISPQPRPDCACEPAWHIADGGYFDNDGIAGLTAFLDEALPAFHAAGGRDVLVVQIRVAFDAAATPSDGTSPAGANGAAVPRRGWPFALTGPIEALLNARGSVQGLRNAQALSLLQARWAGEGVRIDIDDAVFHVDAAGTLPLSWQLTPTERSAVEAVWASDAARAAAAAVAQFVGRP